MQLSEFLIKYKLTITELSKELEKRGNNVNLKFIKNVPEEWEMFFNKHENEDINYCSIIENTNDNIVDHHYSELKKTTHVNDTFIGYIKYVADDYSHGYVIKINNAEYINIYSLKHKKGDYKIIDGLYGISKGEFAIFKLQNEGSKLVSSLGSVLEGIISSYKDISFFSDFKLLNPRKSFIIKYNSDEVNTSEILNINLNKLLLNTSQVENFITSSTFKKNNLIENEIIEICYKTNTLKNDDLSLISWGNNNIEQIKNKSFKTNLLKRDLKGLKTNNIDINTFVKKWSILSPESITYDNIYSDNDLRKLLNLWGRDELILDFFSDLLVENILHFIDNTSEDKQIELFHQCSVSRIEYLNKSFTLKLDELITKVGTANLMKMVPFLNIDSNNDLLFKVFHSSDQESQIELYLNNKVTFIPEISNIIDTIHLFNKFLTFDISNEIELITEYIEKWKEINSEIISYEYLEGLISLELLLNLWKQNIISRDFFNNNLIENLFIAYNYLEWDKESFRQGIPLTLLNEINLNIEAYIDSVCIDNLELYNTTLSFLIWISTVESKKHSEKLINQTNDEVKYNLWLNDEYFTVPLNFAIKNFRKLNSEKQSEVILLSDNEQILKLYRFINDSLSQEAKDKLVLFIHLQVKNHFSTISFDIEVRNSNLKEIAWTGIEEANQINSETSEQAIIEFNNISSNIKNLIIGHNIIGFDCPYLKNLNVIFNDNRLWDTLLVESIISPELKVLSLKTQHNALYDSQFTLKLFYNQVLRLLKSDDILILIESYLPNEILQSLKILKLKYPLEWLDSNSLNEQKNSFFNNQPKDSTLSKKLNTYLKKNNTNTLIIGPELLRADLVNIKQLSHYENNDIKYKVIDIKKVKNLEENIKWEKSVLLSYCNYRTTNELKPLVGGLSSFVLNKIAEVIEFETILADEDELTEFNYTFNFINTKELESKFDLLKNANFEDVIILEPDLISISNSKHLKTFKLKELYENPVANDLWMYFSGGQSYVKVSKEQCLNLGVSITEANNNLDYWIEKYEYGGYRLYSHINWEDTVAELEIKSKKIITGDYSKLSKSKFILPRIRNSKSIYREIVRLNPETIYRKEYWVYQKEIIKSISYYNENPIILVIPRKDEVSDLVKYFKALGYYIPDIYKTIYRQFDFLKENEKRDKLMIIHSEQLATVMSHSSEIELNIILDSFSLYENYYCSKGSSFLKKVIQSELNKEESTNDTEEEGIIDTVTDGDIVVKDIEKDTFLNLKLQLPFLNYTRSLINLYNPNNSLWVLDPRISDFQNLYQWWNGVNKTITISEGNSNYKDELELASLYINSPTPKTETTLSIDYIKKLLSKSFLGNNEWYDYQEEYLDEILPSKKDLLVSLPTGGGKSLLFQAPALYKSSYTNRLSIVITPLKALMEDQVKELWRKGFINNVEYINSDRSLDISLIYRSIASGELSLLYITPERFRSRAFINALTARIKVDRGLEYVIFDEAHCVSQWGHDFRPDYLNSAKAISRIRKESEIDFPFLLFSATVSEKIYNDFNLIF